MALDLWRSSSPRFKRFLTILGFFFFSVIMTIAGLATPLTSEESEALRMELKQLQEAIGNMDVWQSSAFIFRNNFLICLIMFVPVAGPIFGSYVLYNTGTVIAVESSTLQLPPLLVFLFLFIFPYTWMEFAAYSTAFSSGVWLAWRTIKHGGRKELLTTFKLVLICAVMLLAAAVVESVIIAWAPQV